MVFVSTEAMAHCEESHRAHVPTASLHTRQLRSLEGCISMSIHHTEHDGLPKRQRPEAQDTQIGQFYLEMVSSASNDTED